MAGLPVLRVLPAGLVEGADAGLAGPSLGVFVPAIMGAGVVFSLATVLRDLIERGASVATGRRAEVHGVLAAGTALGAPDATEATGLWSRRRSAVAGVAGIAFAIYLYIGATYNYFYPGGYLSGIAWLWAASLALVVASATVGVAALTSAVMGRVPPWAWPILVRTPLLARQVRSARQDRLRWAAIASAVALTVLTVLLSNPAKVRPIDDRLATLADTAWLRSEGLFASWAGSTTTSLAVAGLVGLATWGCARFARLFLAAAGVSIAASLALRSLVDRPRPPYGPWADASMSYPSGHLTQTTLLAVLVPVAVYAMTRRRWLQHLTSVASLAALVFISANRVAVGVHWPTDVVAGILLGLAIGLWTRAPLLDPAQHRGCRRCAFRTATVDGANQRREGDQP